ncbi:hypothetical protein ACF064_34815 [Streptomyces sp. NPDC015492]|uniref:hypothetical protein n=1 Tax=Streptomyces sp. NPDC015492 TaxID=3364958 RepID=UPI0036FA5A6D
MDEGTAAVTPPAACTPDLTGHEDMGPGCRPATSPTRAPGWPPWSTSSSRSCPPNGDAAAEEVLAAQAREQSQFAADLIRRRPDRAVAREIYRLVAQTVQTADVVDDRRQLLTT